MIEYKWNRMIGQGEWWDLTDWLWKRGGPL